MTAPLYLDLLPRGEADFDATVQYLSQTRGTEYAELYTERFGEVIAAVCQRVAEEISDNGKPFDRTHEAASLQFAQPVYRVEVSVSKTRSRRSSAGLWYVFYALEDRAGVGTPDTLAVVAVRHSAVEPFSVENNESD